MAQKIDVPIFGACNLMIETEVSGTFDKFVNSELYSHTLKGAPFIITYKDGLPVGFYNGKPSVQQIIDYVLTLSHTADYFKPIEISTNIQTINNYEIFDLLKYKPVRTDSHHYTNSSPIRGYNP